MKKYYFLSLLLLVSIITKAQNFPWPISSNKVLVYWPFNGNVNDTFKNFSSTPYNIQYVEDRNGNPGKAVYFNGSSSMIKTNFHKRNITEYTISAWVKIPEKGDPTICNHRDIAGKGIGFNLFYDGFGLDGETGFRVIRYKNASKIENNKWYHIVGVWKGITSKTVENDQMKIYINGQEITELNYYVQGLSTYPPLNIDTAMIIGRHFGWKHWFKGSLDDLIIFDYALRPFEIKLLYKGIAITSPNESNNYLLANNTYQIKWLKSDTIGNVNLSYSIDNGKTWQTIANNISDSTYSWLVPDIITDYLFIRVSKSLNDSIFDQTNRLMILKKDKDFGLLLYYPLNGNANNEFNNNYHGIEYNLSDTTDISGFIKSSKYFDSDVDSLVVSSNDLRTGSEGTILMWIKANNYNINEPFMIVSNRKGPNIQQFYLNLHENSQVGLHFRYGNWNTVTDRIIIYPASRSWQPNSWHHVAIRWKREDGTTYLSLFVDGQNVGNTSTSLLIDNPANWIIGGAYESNHAFRGAIDEVRIYNKAIHDSTIYKIYLSGLPYQLIFPEKEYYSYNTTQTIKINVPNYAPDNLNVDFSINNGRTWLNIVSNFNAENDSIIWDIPNITSDSCLLRFSRAKYPDKYYIHNKNFRIVGNILSKNLIAYYPLEKNTFDFSGNDNHALLFNGKESKGIYGINNTAYQFNGKNGFLQLPEKISLNSNSFTFSCWIKTNEYRSNNDYKNYPHIFSGVGNNNSTIGITTTNGYLSIWSKSNTFETVNLVTDYFISDNQWHNIVCSYNGNLLRLYVDGKSTGYSLNTSLTLSDFAINLMAYRKDNLIREYYHEGSIDEVRLYNTALHDTIINYLFNEHLVINEPKDNSDVVKNTKLKIKWIPNNNFKNIKLYYSLDRGHQWIDISEKIKTDSAYLDWIVPNNILDSIIIKLEATNIYNNKITKSYRFINIVDDIKYADLEAWFPFDKNYNDYSRNDHKLFINGTELKPANDRVNNNKACYFNGLVDYIIMPDIIYKPFTSFSFWYKSSSTSGTIFSLGQDKYLSLNNLFDDIPGKIQLSVNSNSIIDTEHTSDDIWHFAVINFDTNKIYLYIDNRLIGSTNINFYYNDTSFIKIGQHNQKLRFKGYIDDIRIYNKFINNELMSNLFNNPSSNVKINYYSDDIKFYPNPVDDILHVSIPSQKNNVIISIYNISGICVYKTITNDKNNCLNVKHLHNGIYILKIEVDKATRYYKFIKK